MEVSGFSMWHARLYGLLGRYVEAAVWSKMLCSLQRCGPPYPQYYRDSGAASSSCQWGTTKGSIIHARLGHGSRPDFAAWPCVPYEPVLGLPRPLLQPQPRLRQRLPSHDPPSRRPSRAQARRCRARHASWCALRRHCRAQPCQTARWRQSCWGAPSPKQKRGRGHGSPAL